MFVDHNTDVFSMLKDIINQEFEIPKDKIKLESRFYDDLDLDSIDAIDLIGRMQAILGQRINPEHFKSVMTVGDVVAIVEDMKTQQKSA